MNAKTPLLERQLDGLMTSYENAQVAAAQAPDLARATLNSQVEVIQTQIEEFFATDAVVAALDELRDLRTAEYEKIGELFADGKITDSELDERIEAIENSPKYRLLGLATELGAFALDDVSVETVEDTPEDDVEFVPFIPVEITTEKLDAISESADSDLEPEELELIGEVVEDFEALEPETIIFTETEADTDDTGLTFNALDDDTEEVDILENATLDAIDVAFEAIESDPADPEEVFYDEEIVASEEPMLPEVEDDSTLDTIAEERPIELEPTTDEVTVEHALIFAEEVADLTKDRDELKVVAPKYLLKSTLRKAADTDLRYVTPEMRREAITSILSILDSEDPLISFMTDAESSQAMFDFTDWSASVIESPKWAAVKSQLIDSVRIVEESPALPATTATISAEEEIATPLVAEENGVAEETTAKIVELPIKSEIEPEDTKHETDEDTEDAEIIDVNSRIEEKVEKEAVASAVEVLVETDNLFEGEISLSEFRSRTGIDTEVFVEVYRTGILELDEKEKHVAIKEIKINATEAILLQMHASNRNLINNADNTVKARILSSVKSEISRQEALKVA